MHISERTIRDIFKTAFSQKKNKTFIDFGEKKISYGELTSTILKLSSFFVSTGIHSGERVVVASTDERFICLLYLALVANGITVVNVDPECGELRANAIIDHCQAKFIFVDQLLRDTWILGEATSGKVIPILAKESTGLFRNHRKGTNSSGTTFPGCLDNIQESEIFQQIIPEDDAYILFTSGTTSSPKGVRISYRALFSHLATLSSVYKLSTDSRIFNNLILSHADGMIQGPMLALFNSASIFRPFKFSIQNIEDTLDIIYRERISHWVMVPTMIGLIYQFKQNDADTLENRYFSYVISCGGKLDPDLWRKFEEKFRTRIINGYGLTETVAGGLFAGPGEDSHIIGTIGKPVDCEVKIVGDDLHEITGSSPGEIWIRGSLVMNGYLNAEEENAKVFSGEWFKTGDIGYKGDDGCFRITGRKKLIIISGGMNISPEEVTEVLFRHPAVKDAVTFGIEEKIWGEIVGCAVVKKENCTLTPEEIISHCRRNLEERKVPSKIYFFNNLPYGPSGKVSVQSIRDKIASFPGEQKSDLVSRSAFLKVAAECFQLPVEYVNLDMAAKQTPAWDSISHLLLVAAMEKHFGIEFSPVEVMNIKVLSDLYFLVVKKVNL